MEKRATWQRTVLANIFVSRPYMFSYTAQLGIRKRCATCLLGKTVHRKSIRFGVKVIMHALNLQCGDVTLFTVCKYFYYEWVLLRVCVNFACVGS